MRWTGLPDWVKEVYPHQEQAVDEIVEAFKEVDIVLLEAPTGSGKTLIAELVRRELNSAKATYVCNDKKLQDQFVRDFPYAKVLKGRANYLTQLDGTKNCDECQKVRPSDSCWYCNDLECPYDIAKSQAIRADLAVVNTSYYLVESNYVGGFGRRDLVIVDEADTMEGILSGFVEFRVPNWILKELRMSSPPKGVRKPRLVEWLNELFVKANDWFKLQKGMEPKQIRWFNRFLDTVDTIRVDLQKEVDDKVSEEGGWLRIYPDEKARDTFIMKPVKVDKYGGPYLWRHGTKFLIMSATIISAEELVDSLGLDIPWKLVTVPMLFPKENRPIIAAPVADVIWSNKEKAIEGLTDAIVQICDRHPGEKILIHTVSRWLMKSLYDRLKVKSSRVFITYDDSAGAAMALRRYEKTENAVLLAPSMDRGVDLKDDLCRVVIVAKVPWFSLDDRTVSARMRMTDGQVWYAIQTIRTVVQMTGRGVRTKEDWAVTYILDRQFLSNLWSRYKTLFPSWWSEAVDTKSDTRWLYKNN